MNTHKDIAMQVSNNIREVPGISKILLFGSVHRNTPRFSSDIDLAIIVKDDMKSQHSLITYYEQEYGILEKIKRTYTEGIPVNTLIFWESEYNDKIIFPKRNNKSISGTCLNDEHTVLYEN